MHDHRPLVTGLGVALTVDARGPLAVTQAAFLHAVTLRGLRHSRTLAFDARTLSLAEVRPLGDVEAAAERVDGFECVLSIDAGLAALIGVSRGRGLLTLAGVGPDELAAVGDGLVRALQDDEGPRGRLPVTFWTPGRYGGDASCRHVAAPEWGEVRDNYAPDTRAALGPLVAAGGPGPGGLLLWHGAPGTGKSYAVRALGHAWASWCDVHVVTDAELLLGGAGGTLLAELARRDDHRGRHRLLVLEDVGELLAADAQARSARAVGRLLNLTDGLLGAGLRTIVLVTTNEPLSRLHPALTRSGRCWAQVEFAPLTVAEARGWLRARGVEPAVEGPAVLADLYAIAAGRAPAGGGPGRVGFG